MRAARMTRPGHIVWLLSFLMTVLTMACIPLRALAIDSGQSKTVDGLIVYVGAMPAEIVKGHRSSHPEARMHGGPPGGQHSYHIVVAVFDAASGKRVEDAKISARVFEPGLAGATKPLEPMRIADTITYGNYFELPYKGRYTISLSIDRPRGVIKAEFEYGHN